MSFFKGKKVLIIGGTGTIGQSLLSYILREGPEVVRILSRDEHKQFELREKMIRYPNIRYLIGDIRDGDRVARAMEDIDYVFHLAAMKHVPSCEYNPYEAVKTNVIGTENVITAARNAGVKRVIFTSTDKAIAPTNAYGASKLMAERLIASAQYNSGGHATIFAAVRFGNVMGSRGSVIPLFKSQIVENRRITVTDKTMSRFMMTLNQATELTIKAMKTAQGGEIFVLKMPVISLKELAEVVIEETAKKININPNSVEIAEIGLRPGEKMYEELMTMEEAKNAFELPDMFVIPNVFLKRNLSYPNAVEANHSSYSSDRGPVAGRHELLAMLKESELI
ncbi:putative nucleoside-diphosphate sugar epimerase [Desulfosporosinus orientis DSM 765]|uniref:Putative nucleoside-diphosphate sugar epimerase n=1 Tax=Desulfosporosinus orientis (strain ATCC 19365 / DSM 765 / NCIMB 8382 / VKM B-1628 / Singapore I) TaxID=768706 RepID=G7WI12_DESOD|nr:polysaccharide biosynthesis protein [Desulfosporosinus orientis]AET70309.1 putative nucleoside-diphosphate sugar epimerase [Desulfosporosinus orientis DSM 765]